MDKIPPMYRGKINAAFVPVLCRSALLFEKTSALRILFDFGLLAVTLNAEQMEKATALLEAKPAPLQTPTADDVEMKSGQTFIRK